MRRTIYLVILLVLGLLLTPSPSAQTNTQPRQTGSQADKDRDRDYQKGKQTTRESSKEERTENAAAPEWFLRQVMIGNMTEIKLGQLAVQKASSPQVKQLAQQMIDGHTKANEQVQKVAQQKGIQAPTDLDQPNKKKEQRLTKLNGAAFDRAYMDMVVQDHREDVERFTKASQNSKDNDVRTLASSILPDLQHHLQMATDTRQQVAGTKTSTKTGRAE